MIEIHDLYVGYGKRTVLTGTRLAASVGEVIGILGHNGAGKTTLLKTVAGWIAPTAGAILLDGDRIDGKAPDEIAALGIGFIPEERRIFPGMTVEQNIELGLLPLSRRRRRQMIERLYEDFPRLGERRRQMGTTLSGGEQQMLAIARALAREPRVLLIDEPSEGLAPPVVDEILAILHYLKQSGLTLLLVEQNLRLAKAICDKFYTLRRGVFMD